MKVIKSMAHKPKQKDTPAELFALLYVAVILVLAAFFGQP